MITHKTPDIDDRSADEIYDHLAGELNDRLQIDADRDPLAHGVLRVLSRYSELIIERLNKVPDKNRDAFLDTLNISRIPPVSAQVPLTFTPVAKLPPRLTPWVPAFTKVAAAPGEGESEPVVFETTRDLAMTNVQLAVILAHDPATDLYSDRSRCAAPVAVIETGAGTGTGAGAGTGTGTGAGAEATAAAGADARASEGGGVVTSASPEGFAFEARVPVDHEFYLDHGIVPGNGGILELRLRFEIKGEPSSSSQPRNLQWYLPSPAGKLLLTPVSDTTSGLTRSGEVVFQNLPEWAQFTILDRKSCWLACRLLDPLPSAAVSGANRSAAPSAGAIPLVAANWESKDGLLDHALFNATQLDLSKDFFPLGARPQFGDVFYLDCCAFAKPQATITLHVKLTNPPSAGAAAPLPPVTKAGKPVIQWEQWDGRRWIVLPCSDGTAALTQDGDISFKASSPFARSAVNGVDGCWIRGRLISGNYGDDERFVMSDDQRLRHIPATLAPPCIQSVTVSSTFSPALVITNNNFVLETVDGGAFFQPFRPPVEARPTLYLGFITPDGDPDALAARQLDLYLHVTPSTERAHITNAPQQLPVLAWQYWNGEDWVPAKVEDNTESLTVPGMISVYPCNAVKPLEIFFGRRGLRWLRVLWQDGQYFSPPALRRLLLNTVSARQTFTVENELAGSSNEMPNQVFRTARVPVLKELQLEVREPDMPSRSELERIRREEGEDAVTVIGDPQGNVQQIWVRWHEEGDFLSSRHDDRHFVVDRQSGEIRFGDGIKGMIPPRGANNIRLRRYQTGGGTGGNKAPGSIAQLRATVPYVAQVTNLEPACGGQDFESWEALRERGSRWLRHRDRAVTVEDYEDIARLASPSVVKSKCCPNRDLAAGSPDKQATPGVVSVIVVPGDSVARPLPDMVLLRRVRDFLDERMAPEVQLVVAAPEYLPISVEASVVPADPHASATLAEKCRQQLEKFLHPTTGGFAGSGWEFGQLPHESDLYAQLESIREVDYVKSLSVRMLEGRPGLVEVGLFLICSGDHGIRLETNPSSPWPSP